MKILVKILAMNNINLLMNKSPQEIGKEIAENERKRRKEKKITQFALSQLSDVSLGSIKRFERTGETSLSSLIKIAFVLGLEEDLEALFKKRSYRSIKEIIDEK